MKILLLSLLAKWCTLGLHLNRTRLKVALGPEHSSVLTAVFLAASLWGGHYLVCGIYKGVWVRFHVILKSLEIIKAAIKSHHHIFTQ